MSTPDNIPRSSFTRWLARWTTLELTARALSDEPSQGFSAWARTTASLVVLLVLLQLLTGLLLAFYYVPSAESAHATVAYIEKSVGAGSWIRSLHLHSSQLLPLALVLHLAQMSWRGSHRRQRVAWLACLALLALSLAGGATGYSLPWDARAFYSTRIAEGLLRGLPLVGAHARLWLLGGADISTLTLSRLSALHVFLIPLLILFTITARLFIFRDSDPTSAPHTHPIHYWSHRQLARHATVAALAFLSLALYAATHPAPLGPPPELAAPGYLPRPAVQFLWLFQLLKYLPGAAASLATLLLPALFLSALALLPFVNPHGVTLPRLRRHPGALLFGLAFLLVAGLTAIAYLEDARDPRTRGQLAQQTLDEEEFRRAPFTPQSLRPATTANLADARSAARSHATPAPPAAYADNCAKCHGLRGEGKSINPSLIGIAAQPGRTLADIIAILQDPSAYALDPRMPSFKDKLTGAEKREIALWIISLKR